MSREARLRRLETCQQSGGLGGGLVVEYDPADPATLYRRRADGTLERLPESCAELAAASVLIRLPVNGR